MTRVLVLGALSLLLLAAVALAILLANGRLGPAERGLPGIPIGVLGDSDSQSYQGRIPVGPVGPPVGGTFHATTFQWPEVLARMRGDQLNLGPWGIWGVPRWQSMARLRDGLGLHWRAPRKEDHRHNLAWASGCETLMEGHWRQAPRLLDIMDEDPVWWQRGVVVIRTGVNNFGKESLDLLAEDPDSPVAMGQMNACVKAIRQTIELIRGRHPDTRFVLVGIYNNVHWPGYFSKFQSSRAQQNIAAGLDHFDKGLQALVRQDPGRRAFFDDRAWFERLWGGRGDDGRPAYRPVDLGLGWRVTNSEGDDPRNAVLANGHAGLVWNVLWVQSLVSLMRTSFGMDIPPVSDDEARAFVAKSLASPPPP
ncbi:SGNH/GDSL hydrolase family protein [Ideonella sp. NS12-5]|uniref:SGNH/GDSL hydrolase family protein n=2 Tax=Ideonella oryzae TaxID=2937441 RepID=A0ABT1BU23_9BURK|nr:SGNH/GDSL hydrolase family protein [Ideonella oryzae]